MAKFSKEPPVLHEPICIALGTFLSKCFLEPERTNGLKSLVEVDGLHYKKVKRSEDAKLERPMKVGDEDAKRKRHGWKEVGSAVPKFDAYCDKFLGIVTKFESRWDDHLCRICDAKLWIELASHETRPLHWALYRAGSKARRFKKPRYVSC